MDLSHVTFIDLFAGIGGFRFALKPFGARCVFSSEIDKHAANTYAANHGDRPAGDITKIDENDIPPHDILCGGFPCQPFSISGDQKGFEDIRGTMFFEIVRIAKKHQPMVLFLENVDNLEGHDDGRTLRRIRETLDLINYDLRCEVLNASHFGVPHARERIVMVAFRKDLGQDPCDIYSEGYFKFPQGDDKKVYLRDILVPGDHPKLAINFAKCKGPIWHNNFLGVDGNPVDTQSIPIPALEPIRIGMVNKGRQGERIYHPNGHAITLSSAGGGMGAKTGMYLINGVVRKLSPKECSRLMGLPEDFVLDKSPTQCYKQFGNGVVVDVLSSVFDRIVKQGVFK